MNISNLHLLTYVPGVAEHAREVNRYIRSRFSRKNFIFAIDLPSGFEEKVLSAVKKLPVVSIILDITGRGIPVIPTHAPIEAVRLYLESGMDMHFVDSSLPVRGDIGEWYRFVDIARNIGLERVLGDPKFYGISLSALFGSQYEGEGQKIPSFIHLSSMYRERVHAISPLEMTEYIDSRNRLMAKRVKKLIDSGEEIVFVCNERNALSVLRYLEEKEQVPFDDRLILPTITCRVPGRSIHKLTQEIPYVMYAYEMARNGELDRFSILKDIFLKARTIELPADIEASIRYSMKLAMTEGQLFPDTYLLAVAARSIVDDSYAKRILDISLYYPFADAGIHECPGLEGYLDYNLQRVSHRTICLKPEDPEHRAFAKKKGRKFPFIFGYYRWVRNGAHIETEKRLLSFIRSLDPFRDGRVGHRPRKFVSGLEWGIDARNTLRGRINGDDALYVRRKRRTSVAAYIIDYGKRANTKFFIDRVIKGIGTAWVEGKTYTISTVVLFPWLECEVTDIFIGLDTNEPFPSSLSVALEYAKKLLIFSDRGENVLCSLGIPRNKYRIYPLREIPSSLLEGYQSFTIVKDNLKYNPLGD